MTTCRSCRARIVWAVTTGGRRIPVDAEPVEGGNVILHASTNPREAPTATVLRNAGEPSLFGDDGPRYVSHFATCPDASAHRRPR